ncbi:MAG: GAF domain-containing protein, partial [Nitrospira sp.]
MDQSMSSITLQEPQNPESRPIVRYFGLRIKFVVVFSLILIMTCSSLSWYFIDTRRQAMIDNLEELGTILLTNTVRNEHFRIGGIVLEDRPTLDQFMQSLMAIDHVVYVEITDSDGRILDRHSKRTRTLSNRSPQHSQQPIYPDDRMVESLLQAPLTVPLLSRFVLSAEQTLVPEKQLSAWLLPFLVREETLYDFAMPVLRKSSFGSTLSKLSIDLEEKSFLLPATGSPVVGLVRIGITDAPAKQALLVIVRNVSLLTLLIIAGGILSAHLLTSRITTPLRRLASAARQLAEGHDRPTPLVVAASNDEVSELTQVFNDMTQSLHERNHAITMNLGTIRRQVMQLTTVHQVSTAIASASVLDMSQLLETVLQLLAENLGFSKMAVLLYHPEKHCCSIAQVFGAAPEIAEAASRVAVPVHDGSITADLLFRRKPFLINDIETMVGRFYPPILELLRRSGITSVVIVPLQSQAKVLGFLAGSRGAHQCSEEDLHILLTIAGHVAAA